MGDEQPKKKKKKPFIPKARRGEGMLRCEKCGKPFRTMSGLIKHSFKAHDPGK